MFGDLELAGHVLVETGDLKERKKKTNNFMHCLQKGDGRKNYTTTTKPYPSHCCKPWTS